MVKHTEAIRRQIADELFECVYHFVKLALKGLTIRLFWLSQNNHPPNIFKLKKHKKF